MTYNVVPPKVASTFLYFTLAIWLSMHASVTSQSFGTRKYCWKPSSSSNCSIRVVRAYPLTELPRRVIRGNSISVNSTLPPH